MAFFQQLIADLEHSPPKRDAQPLGVLLGGTRDQQP